MGLSVYFGYLQIEKYLTLFLSFSQHFKVVINMAFVFQKYIYGYNYIILGLHRSLTICKYTKVHDDVYILSKKRLYLTKRQFPTTNELLKLLHGLML